MPVRWGPAPGVCRRSSSPAEAELPLDRFRGALLPVLAVGDFSPDDCSGHRPVTWPDELGEAGRTFVSGCSVENGRSYVH